MSRLIGQTLGDYQVENLLSSGSGGMGQVFQVRRSDGTLFALKVLHGIVADDPTARTSFKHEMAALRRLDHPNVVRFYGSDVSHDPPYLVMELVPDGSLQTLLDRRMREPWPLLLGLDLVRQAAEGLAYIHDSGIVHRDIKPANLLLRRAPSLELVSDEQETARFELKIADFGLALSSDLSRRTVSHQILGTPRYIAPEQLKDPRAADARSDIYALGVILYEVATGAPPLPIQGFHDVHRHHDVTPIPLPRSLNPELPLALEALIMECLAGNPADRLASSAELAARLGALIEAERQGLSTQAAPLSQDPLHIDSSPIIGVFLDHTTLTLTPGQRTELRVTIRNLGKRVDDFTITVTGFPETWLTLPREPLQVNDRDTASATLGILVPEGSEGRAGTYESVRVCARSGNDAAEVGVQPASWIVREFAGCEAQIEPRRVMAKRQATYEFSLRNSGNITAGYTLNPGDDAHTLGYTFARGKEKLDLTKPIELEPGKAVNLSLAVQAPRHWLGREREHQFAVAVTGGSEFQQPDATFVQRPAIPAWAVTLATLLVALLAFVAFSPPIFIVSPPSLQTVAANAPVNLSWRTLNAGRFELRYNNGIDTGEPSVTFPIQADGPATWFGQADTSGDVGGFPVTTTVELIAYNLFGLRTDTNTVVIGVDYEQPFVENFSANAETITYGDPLTVSLRVRNADQLTLNPGDISIPVVPDGLTTATLVLTPTENITYSLLATTGRGSEKSDDEIFSVVVTPKIERFVVITPPSGLVAGAQPNVRVEWKVAGATSVDILIDGRLFKTVPVREGAEEIPAPPADAKITLRAQRREEADASETIALAVRAPECRVTHEAGLHRAPFDDGTVFRSLDKGQKLVPLERNSETSWLWAEVPGEGRAGRGWVDLEALDCNLPEDVLRIAEIVPTARPTSTPTQNLAATAAEDARRSGAIGATATQIAAFTATSFALGQAATQTAAAESSAATQTALALATPRLEITELAVGPGSIVAQNVPMNVSVTICNRGLGTARGIPVNWRPRGRSEETLASKLATLAPNACASVAFSYTYTQFGSFDSSAFLYEDDPSGGKMYEETIDVAETRPLRLFWNASRADHCSVASDEGFQAQLATGGYIELDDQGLVLTQQLPGTIPLVLYWNPKTGWEDNATLDPATVGNYQPWLSEQGYVELWTEGYIFAESYPGTIPLRLLYNETRKDFATFSDQSIIQDNIDNYEYEDDGVRGYIFPAAP